jgi:hypothetical protein
MAGCRQLFFKVAEDIVTKAFFAGVCEEEEKVHWIRLRAFRLKAIRLKAEAELPSAFSLIAFSRNCLMLLRTK